MANFQSQGMRNNNKRPVYLNLLKIRLPVGVVLLLPFALYMLQRSLQDPAVFTEIAARLATLEGRMVLLVIVWAFAQHFFSGIRHLLLDIGIADEKAAARRGAWLSFAATGFVVILTGACLWNV